MPVLHRRLVVKAPSHVASQAEFRDQAFAQKNLVWPVSVALVNNGNCLGDSMPGSDTQGVDVNKSDSSKLPRRC